MRDINIYTEEYLKKSFEDYQVKYRKKNILEIFNNINPTSVLEIGCGQEPLFLDIDMKDINLYTVVEPSEAFCNHAKEVCPNNTKIQIINDFFENTENTYNKKYDLIICSSLLHELSQPERIINHAKLFMNNNSIFYVNVPNAKSFHRLLAVEMGLIRNEHEMSERNIRLQQNKVYDIEKLTSLLVENGLSVYDRGSYFVKLFDHKHMEWFVDEMGEKALDGLDNMIKYMPEMGSEIFAICRLNEG